MIITIEYDLPDDESEFDMAHRGREYYDTLYALVSALRSWRKHGHAFASTEDALDAAWDMIFELTPGPVPGWDD